MRKKLVYLTCIVFIIMAVSGSAMALGIGVFVDGGIGEIRMKNYYTNVTGVCSYSSYNKGLDYLFGGGLALDTCVVDGKLFNYRLQIGCDDYVAPHEPASWVIQGSRMHYAIHHTVRLSMTHTFGFGIIRNNAMRLWTGPSVSAHYYPIEKRAHLLVPGLSLGVNMHLNESMSLTVECGVKYEWAAPKRQQDYITTVNGHVTLGILFRVKQYSRKTKA